MVYFCSLLIAAILSLIIMQLLASTLGIEDPYLAAKLLTLPMVFAIVYLARELGKLTITQGTSE